MQIIQKPKGTNDVYDSYGRKVLYIRNLIENIAKTYNYNYFRTPTFEKTELFKRGVGDTTDIVEKETYDFVDKGNRNMTLKPEGTSSIVRSIIENKLYVNGMVTGQVPLSDGLRVYIGNEEFQITVEGGRSQSTRLYKNAEGSYE